MNAEEMNSLGNIIVDTLFSDKILPSDVIKKLGKLVSDPGYNEKLKTLWDKKNMERLNEGKNLLEIKVPILLTRGYDKFIAVEKIKKYLPEEKIMINKDIFRSKLNDINFNNLDVFQEKRIIDELKNESIGLSKDDTILYYNLIKINSYANVHFSKDKNETTSTYDFSITNYSENIFKLIENELFLTDDNLMRLNNGKKIHKEVIIRILKDKIIRNKINPDVILLMLGEKNKKYINKLKCFIEDIVEKKGEDPVEVLNLLGLYIEINDANDQLIQYLHITSPLYSFLTDKIGEIKTIYYAAMIYIYTFMSVLTTQVYEISNKYKHSNNEQKSKLLKLYNSEERIHMLISNAKYFSLKKISEFKVEMRELYPDIRKFISSNINIIKSSDLFDAMS